MSASGRSAKITALVPRNLRGLLLGVLLLAACAPSPPPQTVHAALCGDVETCEQALGTKSKAEAEAFDRALPPHKRRFAIIGNGIAGATAALQFEPKKSDEEPIRVYGWPSFWSKLDGLPEIWQTDLVQVFAKAYLADPTIFGVSKSATSARIPRESMMMVNMEALLRAHAAYLETGPVTVAPDHDGWLITDRAGRTEIISDALIVATGVLAAKHLSDVVPGSATARNELAKAGKILTGDEYLMGTTDVHNKVVGILGAGGSSADCIRLALKGSETSPPSKMVVVWGDAPSPLSSNSSFTKMEAELGDRICRVKGPVTEVQYTSVGIMVNPAAMQRCVVVATGVERDIPPVDLLVESLGRNEADPPAEVDAAANGRKILYNAVPGRNHELIALRVDFAATATQPKSSVPICLIGAVASWIPIRANIVDRQAWADLLNRTVEIVNEPLPGGPRLDEHGRQGFAVAAYMGSHFGERIKTYQDGGSALP